LPQNLYWYLLDRRSPAELLKSFLSGLLSQIVPLF